MAEVKNQDKRFGVMHGTLLAAAFMTAYDRTKNIGGGLLGAALAGSAIGARGYLTNRFPEERGMINAVANAIEFSAITSLLGSSMMRGGFLHKSVGKPVQRFIATKGFVASTRLIPKELRGTLVGDKKSIHSVVRGLDANVRKASEELERISAEAISNRKGATGFLGKTLFWGMGKLGIGLAAGSERVAKRYSGIFSKYLKGMAIGPRGPFEATSGLFDLSQKLIKMTEHPLREVRGAIGTFLGKGKDWLISPVLWAGKKMGASEFDTALGQLAQLRKSGAYRFSKGFVGSRKYIEGFFGSPSVGELVVKHGSIKKIPLDQYGVANIKDLFYGATPGLILGSPFIAYQGLKYASGKAYNKIIGHHPGWANKMTESAIDSEFTAGESWTQINNALRLMGVKQVGKKGIREWSELSSSQVINSLSKHINVRAVKDLGYSANVRPIHKLSKRSLIGRSKGMEFYNAEIRYDPSVQIAKELGLPPERVLKGSLAHEALEISTKRSIVPGKNLTKYQRAVLKHALSWTHRDVGVITGEIRFDKALGGYKKLGKMRLGGIHMGENEFMTDAGLKEWDAPALRFADRYKKILNIGIGTNAGALEAEAVSKVMSKNTRIKLLSKPTAGLVNKVLHNRKTMHAVKSIDKKVAFLFEGV